MHIRMDTTAQDLIFILTLCRARSISRAAEELRVEQSTVSRQLAALEEKMGAILYSRHRSGITPSTRTLQLVQWAEKVEHIVRSANKTDSETKTEITGEVHITCPDAIADRVLAPRLSEIIYKYPHLSIKITSGASLMDLDKLDCDIALRIGSKPSGDCVCVRISESPILVFGLEKFTPPHGKARLQDLPLLHRSEHHSQDSKMLWNMGIKTLALSSNRMTTCLLAAEAGVGVVLLPQAFGRLIGSLQQIDIEAWPAPNVSLYLAAPRAVRKLPHVNIVWSWIQSIFSGSV